MVRRVILDADTGVDDALAILLAMRSPELHVEAITAVSGNILRRKMAVVVDDGLVLGVAVVKIDRSLALQEEVVVDEGHED